MIPFFIGVLTCLGGESALVHVDVGMDNSNAALLLPELQEAGEAGNERGVAAAIAHLEATLGRVVSKLGNIGRILG